MLSQVGRRRATPDEIREGLRVCAKNVAALTDTEACAAYRRALSRCVIRGVRIAVTFEAAPELTDLLEANKVQP